LSLHVEEEVEYDPAAEGPFHSSGTRLSDHTAAVGLGRGESSRRSLEDCPGFPVTSNSNEASSPGVNVAGTTTYLSEITFHLCAESLEVLY
jgi:hypothetical protein